MFEEACLDCGVRAGMAAEIIGVGVVEVSDGGGNVHTAESLEARVGFVLSHPSADEGVCRHVVVAGKLWGRCGGTVEVYLYAEVGNRIADAVVWDEFGALWGH